MCTAMSLKSKNNSIFFGRNMDFSYELDPEVYIVPKDYIWNGFFNKHVFKNEYKFIGTGQNIGKIIFADGVNESGLAVAALYFQGYAQYDENLNNNKVTLGSIEVTNYLLGNCSSVDEVINTIRSVDIVGVEDDITKTVAPLHWFVVDKDDNCITIEKTMNGMQIIQNDVKVLANSPNFEWHMTNLRNYLNISPKQNSETNWNNIKLTPFGQGAGTIGLSGDYTSPSRFVKTVFQTCFIELPDTDDDTLISCFNVLSSVSIPKGIVITDRNSADYTQYTVFMNTKNQDYYFKTHDNYQIFKVNINDADSNQIVSLGKLKRKVKFIK